MRGHIGRGDFIIGSDLQIQNGFLRRLSANLSGDVRNAQIGDEKDEKSDSNSKRYDTRRLHSWINPLRNDLRSGLKEGAGLPVLP